MSNAKSSNRDTIGVWQKKRALLSDDTIFLIEKVRGVNKRPVPSISLVPLFRRVFLRMRAHSDYPFSLSLSLSPPFSMSHQHSFTRDARSILGNTSCQFPMLYKVSVSLRRPRVSLTYSRCANRFYFENFYAPQVRKREREGGRCGKVIAQKVLLFTG